MSNSKAPLSVVDDQTISASASGMSDAPAISSNAMLLSDENFGRCMKLAEMMATATATVPNHFRGKPGDCLAVVMQAAQWRMNPFSVAQKTHLVNGSLGYEAQLVNAVVQESGAIVGRFHYQYGQDGTGHITCRVGAQLRGEREITWNEWISEADVTTKNSPLWKTNPRQQLGYLQVKNWARAYCPGAIMGVYTPDELQEKDMGPADVVTPAPAAPTSNARTNSLKEKMGVKPKAPEPAGPRLDEVMRAIESARDGESLKAAKALGMTMDEGPDKEQAITAYGARVKQIKAQAATVDPETGELLNAEQGATEQSTEDFLAGMDEENIFNKEPE